MLASKPSGVPPSGRLAGLVMPWSGLAVAMAILVVDQLSKYWIVHVVMNPPRAIPVTGFLNLVMGWNRGVSFGLLSSDIDWARWALVALALGIIGFLAAWLVRADRLLVRLALGSIIGGAIGNLIDRLQFGAVADFLDFHAFGYHWYTFNVADTGISVGAVVLLLDALFQGGEKPKNTGSRA